MNIPRWNFGRGKTLTAIALLVLGYWAVLSSFGTESHYFAGFDSSGRRLLLYNVGRVVFAIYLVALFVLTGDLLMQVCRGSIDPDSSPEDWVLVRLFSGFSLWNLTILILGVGASLHRPLLITLSSLTLGAGLLARLDAFDRLPVVCKRMFREFPGREPRFLLAIGFGMFLTSFAVLLVVKGIFPAGGHDYYTHYFHFYTEVVSSGAIRPNDVWYHYYYSKGLGALFLAMALTDPLAPSLVTLGMMFGASVALSAALGYLKVPGAIRWSIAALFLVLYVFTPGPPLNMNHGGWGDFEKPHELQTALLAFVTYALIRKGTGSPDAQRNLEIATLLALPTAIVITPSIGVFYLLSIAILSGSYLLRRDFRMLRGLGLLALAIVVTLVGILGLNQSQTGLASDQGIRWFWQYANFERLDEWGVLPELIRIYGWHVQASMTASPPLDSSVMRFMFNVFRLDLTWPLLALLAALAIVSILLVPSRARAWRSRILPLHSVMALALAGAVLAIGVGRAQDISFYRFSSFLVPIPIVMGFALLYAVGDQWYRVAEGGRFEAMRAATQPIALCVGLAIAFAPVVHQLNSPRGREVLKVGWAFATGKISIGQAYSGQTAWPGRLPWGGQYPAAREAFRHVPLGSRVRSLHTLAYCMAPGCRYESHVSYKIGANYLDVMYGSAIEARRALSESGLNYFFVSKDLPIQDPLAGNALFRPTSIADQMGVVWTDGVSVLLTWKDAPGTSALAGPWIAAYSTRFRESRIDLESPGPDRHIAKIFKQILLSGRPSDLKYLDWQSGTINRP